MRVASVIAIFFTVHAGLGEESFGDAFILKDGTCITGRIYTRTSYNIFVRLPDGKSRNITVDKLDQILKGEDAVCPESAESEPTSEPREPTAIRKPPDAPSKSTRPEGARRVGRTPPDKQAGVIVLKNGHRRQGRIVDLGDSYRITSRGVTQRIAKSDVQQLITYEDLLREFHAKIEKADLRDGAQLSRLESYAEEHQLSLELPELHAATFDVRRKDLSSTDLCDDVRLSRLQTFGLKHGLTNDLHDLYVEAYSARRAVANDAMSLARLSNWCAYRGLHDESTAAEQAALKMAPEDATVRWALGHAKEPTTGDWATCAWSVDVVSATLRDKYQEGIAAPGLQQLTWESREKDFATAIITVEFHATGAAIAASIERQKAGVAALANETLSYVRGCLQGRETREPKLPVSLEDLLQSMIQVSREKPSRLFVSKRIRLVLQNGAKVHPVLTSAPSGAGCTHVGSYAAFQIVPKKTRIGAVKPGKPEYGKAQSIRLAGLTVAVFFEEESVQLVLVYSVPKDTREAVLRFDKCPPITVVLTDGT